MNVSIIDSLSVMIQPLLVMIDIHSSLVVAMMTADHYYLDPDVSWLHTLHNHVLHTVSYLDVHHVDQDLVVAGMVVLLDLSAEEEEVVVEGH